MVQRTPRLSTRLVVLLFVLAALLAGCKVDATVSVRVRDDGSGAVRVAVVADAEAVKSVETGGTKIEDSVRLSDLSAAGWKVGSWARAQDGSASIVLSHRFSSVDQVASIVRQISGENGPLQGVRVTRSNGGFSTDYTATGRADLANVKTGVPTDAELVANLSGQQVDPNVIDQELLAQVKASFALEVIMQLPGAKAQTFTPKPGGAIAIDASSSVTSTRRILFLGAAAGFAILALIVGFAHRRRRVATGPRRASSEPGAPPPPRRSGSTT